MKNYWLDRKETVEQKIERMLGANVIWLEDPLVGQDAPATAWEAEAWIARQLAEWDFSSDSSL